MLATNQIHEFRLLIPTVTMDKRLKLDFIPLIPEDSEVGYFFPQISLVESWRNRIEPGKPEPIMRIIAFQKEMWIIEFDESPNESNRIVHVDSTNLDRVIVYLWREFFGDPQEYGLVEVQT